MLSHRSSDTIFHILEELDTEGNKFSFFFFFPVPCGILVPQPGMEPVPCAVEARVLNHWASREVPGGNNF